MEELKAQEAEALDIIESLLDVADMKNTGPMYADTPPRSGMCRIPEDDAAKLRQYIAARRAAPENKPLTLEELQEMDGEPVWIKADHYGVYADVVTLVGKEDGENWVSFAINNRLRENGHGKTWLAYARRPEDAP